MMFVVTLNIVITRFIAIVRCSIGYTTVYCTSTTVWELLYNPFQEEFQYLRYAVICICWQFWLQSIKHALLLATWSNCLWCILSWHMRIADSVDCLMLGLVSSLVSKTIVQFLLSPQLWTFFCSWWLAFILILGHLPIQSWWYCTAYTVDLQVLPKI